MVANLSKEAESPEQERDASFSLAMLAAQNGDSEAYRSLLQVLRGLAMGYSRRFLTRMGKFDAATQEDVVQEILMAVHAKRHTYDVQQPFLPWFFAIARYKLIDHGRRERRQPLRVTLDAVDDYLAAPTAEEPGTAQDLELLLARLPDKARRALTLVKLDGLSVAEAAASTGMSESAIKVSIHRTLKSLRQRLRRTEAP